MAKLVTVAVDCLEQSLMLTVTPETTIGTILREIQDIVDKDPSDANREVVSMSVLRGTCRFLVSDAVTVGALSTDLGLPDLRLEDRPKFVAVTKRRDDGKGVAGSGHTTTPRFEPVAVEPNGSRPAEAPQGRVPGEKPPPKTTGPPPPPESAASGPPAAGDRSDGAGPFKVSQRALPEDPSRATTAPADDAGRRASSSSTGAGAAASAGGGGPPELENSIVGALGLLTSAADGLADVEIEDEAMPKIVVGLKVHRHWPDRGWVEGAVTKVEGDWATIKWADEAVSRMKLATVEKLVATARRERFADRPAGALVGLLTATSLKRGAPTTTNGGLPPASRGRGQKKKRRRRDDATVVTARAQPPQQDHGTNGSAGPGAADDVDEDVIDDDDMDDDDDLDDDDDMDEDDPTRAAAAPRALDDVDDDPEGAAAHAVYQLSAGAASVGDDATSATAAAKRAARKERRWVSDAKWTEARSRNPALPYTRPKGLKWNCNRSRWYYNDGGRAAKTPAELGRLVASIAAAKPETDTTWASDSKWIQARSRVAPGALPVDRPSGLCWHREKQLWYYRRAQLPRARTPQELVQLVARLTGQPVDADAAVLAGGGDDEQLAEVVPAPPEGAAATAAVVVAAPPRDDGLAGAASAVPSSGGAAAALAATTAALASLTKPTTDAAPRPGDGGGGPVVVLAASAARKEEEEEKTAALLGGPTTTTTTATVNNNSPAIAVQHVFAVGPADSAPPTTTPAAASAVVTAAKPQTAPVTTTAPAAPDDDAAAAAAKKTNGVPPNAADDAKVVVDDDDKAARLVLAKVTTAFEGPKDVAPLGKPHHRGGPRLLAGLDVADLATARSADPPQAIIGATTPPALPPPTTV